MRGFWADAWHAGFKNATDTTNMVNNAAAGHFNAIFLNVRNAGQIYFFPTAPNVEPRASVSPSNYDVLADVITKAHALGIKVHCWIVSNDVAPTWYSNQYHVMNVHPEWLTRDSAGNYTNTNMPDYWLDPGVPEAMTWNYNICMDLVRHYDIDGLHFDYIRYPGPDSGYNATAIARFNTEYGRTGQPSTTDADFSNWRRRQVTDFVKKVYANAVALKPSLVISAATYGSLNSATNSKYQDWGTWMSKGYLDADVPMIYYGPSGNGSFQTYVNADINYRYGRHMYIGQGAGSNPVSNTITQYEYVRSKGAEGVVSYSYATNNNEGASTSTFFNTIGASVFPTAVSAPAMGWKIYPTQGILKGTVTGPGGGIIYNATITINGQTGLSDGTGFYALMKLTPGTYTATCQASGHPTANAQVSIVAGTVTTRDFILVPDSAPPTTPTNLTATVIGPNQINLSWTASTDNIGIVGYRVYRNGSLAATSSTTSYSDTGVSSGDTFSYQVTAYDYADNESTRSNTATATTPVLQDIVMDNTAAGFTSTWSTATDTTTKYGADYRYGPCSPSTGRIARWIPDFDLPGMYLVSVWYPEGADRSTRAPYTIYYSGGSTTVQVDQTVNGGQWNAIGLEPFMTGPTGYVRLGNGTGEPSSTIVCADAVRFFYVRPLDTSPPIINSVSVTPRLVSGGATIDVSVSVTDDVGVASVTACGTALVLTGSDTYSGSIATNPALGEHVVNVVAADAAGNQSTNADESYITAPVYGLANASLLTGEATQAGATQFLFKTWGSVTFQDSSHFTVSDGSPTPVRVYCPGHGLTTGWFVTVLGIWNCLTTPPQLDAQPEQIRVIY